jgi:hypothetical protein
MPASSSRQFNDLPDKLLTKVSIEFEDDPRSSARRKGARRQLCIMERST